MDLYHSNGLRHGIDMLSPAGVGVVVPVRVEALTQTELWMVDAALQGCR